MIPAGDDSAAPGTPITPEPGVYTPSVAPSGGGFEIKVQGVDYYNLCLRFQITPAVGKPFNVQGFNAVLIVRAFLAQPNNVQGVLAGLVNSDFNVGVRQRNGRGSAVHGPDGHPRRADEARNGHYGAATAGRGRRAVDPLRG